MARGWRASTPPVAAIAATAITSAPTGIEAELLGEDDEDDQGAQHQDDTDEFRRRG